MFFLAKLYGKVEGSKTKISAFNVWKNHLLKSVQRNNSMYPKVREYNFYSNGNCTMSGKTRISYYYTIDGYPTKIPMAFKEKIRRRTKGNVRVSFISLFEPTRIDWSSPQMRSKLKTWKAIDADSEEVTEYNYIENVSSMDSKERRKASLVYLGDADARRQRNLFKYRTMMVVSGNRGNDFDVSIEEILSYCKNTGIIITRVEDRISDFLRAFSPFSMELGNGILSQVGSNTITDEQLARFSNYDQGKIGKKGIMFGTDIYSGYAVYKLIKKNSTDAENILLTAETGGGKSYFLKGLLIQIIGLPEYVGTINDIEGFEYIPFGSFIANHDKVVVLNMAEGQGCYYDPFEIILTGIKELDEDLFQFSKSFTNSYFRVLIGEDLVIHNVWAQKIVNNAIARAYSDLGVDEYDMSTWSKTNGYGLFYVYSKFKELYQECYDLRQSATMGSLELYDKYKLNDGYLDALDKVVAKLSEYFEPLEHGGTRSNVFRKKVSLAEIVDAKLVINSFGMAGKSADTIDPTQMSLAQLSAANISYIRSIFSKAKGKYNFKVWEEFQRWGMFPGSANTIKTAITGGRKLGDINFIVTNNVKDLLDDDRFAIFDNIQSFAIGAIVSANTRKRLCEQLSVPMLLPDLDSLVTKKGNAETFENEDDTTSIYDKAFLIQLDKSVTTIAKMMLPKHISKSGIFDTGVNIEG